MQHLRPFRGGEQCAEMNSICALIGFYGSRPNRTRAAELGSPRARWMPKRRSSQTPRRRRHAVVQVPAWNFVEGCSESRRHCLMPRRRLPHTIGQPERNQRAWTPLTLQGGQVSGFVNQGSGNSLARIRLMPPSSRHGVAHCATGMGPRNKHTRYLDIGFRSARRSRVPAW